MSHDLETSPMLFIYCDGGPDHRLTYVSVQLSLISLFLQLDLDFLCACCTAPCHSWRNPVERIMSIINLGMQCVGLMMKEVGKEWEGLLTKCNSLTQLRQAAKKTPALVGEVIDSIAPVKILLASIIMRLKLKEKPFEVYPSASDGEIRALWNSLLAIDPSLSFDEKMVKASLESYPVIQRFIAHCCQLRHYSFCVKKCGSSSCTLCKPPRLPSDVFASVYYFLPDPVPMGDGHYKCFDDVYGTITDEKHRQHSHRNVARKKHFLL